MFRITSKAKLVFLALTTWHAGNSAEDPIPSIHQRLGSERLEKEGPSLVLAPAPKFRQNGDLASPLPPHRKSWTYGPFDFPEQPPGAIGHLVVLFLPSGAGISNLLLNFKPCCSGTTSTHFDLYCKMMVDRLPWASSDRSCTDTAKRNTDNRKGVQMIYTEHATTDA
ncbi:hypothetical protein BDZ45DRAFT_805112 [Acephala macrosclerotiorum]|nr:hypothetical protein BDZ45DRAFT_805112 [Acephala macrosclerotiorum]